MKTVFLLLTLLVGGHSGFAQTTRIDSLKRQLDVASADSVRFLIAESLSYSYATTDSNEYYSQLAGSIAVRNGRKINYALLLGTRAWRNINRGQYAAAKAYYDLAFEIAENPENEKFWRFSKGPYIDEERLHVLANLHLNYGLLMGASENREQQAAEYRKTYQIANKTNDVMNIVYTLSGLALVYLQNNQLDSARYCIQEALKIPPHLYNSTDYSSIIYINGLVSFESGQYDLAQRAFLAGRNAAIREKSNIGMAINCLGMSKVFRAKNRLDSSYVYGIKSLRFFERAGNVEILNLYTADAYENLYELFRQKNQPDSVLYYLQRTKIETDKQHRRKLDQLANFQQMLLNEQAKLKDLEKETIQIQSRIQTYSFLTALVIFASIGALLYRNNRQKQKANVRLQAQKEEIDHQRTKAEQALTDLQAAQTQLIQKEKLASLGELTAGIAHEIQNPLNFVNNFAEVSTELVEEQKEALAKNDLAEADTIADDLRQNLQKITEHGQRASSIVRGMLEHSRQSTGERQPTDLNALAQEYLNLAYQGQRAKNPTFSCQLDTHFAPDLPLVNAVSSDLGRVLLNLLNNAFYAVREKNKTAGLDYQPSVSVSTQRVDGQVRITVADNGTGIPEAVKAKVFQPFFTTKPTGEGTGLGLSLAYDIVVKAHCGTLTVESTEGEGATFTIGLPDSI